MLLHYSIISIKEVKIMAKGDSKNKRLITMRFNRQLLNTVDSVILHSVPHLSRTEYIELITANHLNMGELHIPRKFSKRRAKKRAKRI
jgi:hypothetical protein